MAETEHIRVEVKRGWLQCDQCTHRWVPTNQETFPSECPRCSSRRWNEKGKPLRFDRPTKGARLYHCLVCGWDWFTRSKLRPNRCAKCTSPHWAVGIPPEKMRRRGRAA